MEIVSIIVVILLIFLIFKFINKSKSSDTPLSKSIYSNESISILNKYFKDKDFLSNNDITDFKTKLEIKSIHKDELKVIIKDIKHRVDVHTSFCINNNKAYNDFTTFKLAANEVLDYCVKKDKGPKKGIILLLLTLENDSIKELLDKEFDDVEFLVLFYKLLPGFYERYNKRKNS